MMRRMTPKTFGAGMLAIFAVAVSVLLFFTIKDVGDFENSGEQIASLETLDNDPIQTESQSEAKLDEVGEKSPGLSQLYESMPGRVFAGELDLSFGNATNSLDALSAIDNADLKGLQIANDWRIKLASICSETSLLQSEGREWLQSRADDFCGDYTGPIDESDLDVIGLDDLYGSTYERNFEEKLFDKLQATSIRHQSDLITSQLKNSVFPEDIDAIQSVINQYIREAGFSPWNPLQLDRDLPHYHKSQNIALIMFKCMRFRSCGQNTIWFMQHCQMMPACESTWNFDDIFYYHTTPLEYGTATEILTEFHRN